MMRDSVRLRDEISNRATSDPLESSRQESACSCNTIGKFHITDDWRNDGHLLIS
ncbi:hypothetical protein HanXRQr2_Chr15g0687811 [Helianthus annuus]|uniref:Uncharacterized protein n=1 Tax=Helianthus annuus TaxID=4232 RepID=A0A9K3DZE0_HELAN|nr:hypothetical protein HanXRQr2_Chr15g0687811 [Helianthus annuus]KAJ0830815.1 hypothetical protein HanPSC8_Chr15g0659791 [Helianthus annuus]